MERIQRETSSEERDRIRDRSLTKKKRRFDSGPNPEKIKEELTTGRTKEDNDDGLNSLGPLGSTATKSASYLGSDKHAKRAYIGNIPIDTDHIDLQCFLNISMRAAGGCLEDGNPVLNSSFVNLDKRFMFVELRSVEETSALMQLDGIVYRNNSLKIRRPVDYDRNPVIEPDRPVPKLNLTKLGIVSTHVENSSLRLFVGGFALNMTDDQIK